VTLDQGKEIESLKEVAEWMH